MTAPRHQRKHDRLTFAGRTSPDELAIDHAIAPLDRLSREMDRTTPGEPLRWLRALVAKPSEDECVPWPFAKNGNGYGWARYESSRIGAHRLSLVLATGKNPPDMDAAHSCHNRPCVNPRHLSWKTRRGNLLDKRKDGTSHSKLTIEDAGAIRLTDESTRILAERYGLSISAIQKIRSGRNWK